MRRRYLLILTAIIVVLVLAGGYAYRSALRQLFVSRPNLPPAETLSDIINATVPTSSPAIKPPATNPPTTKPVVDPVIVPRPVTKNEINLAVPFASQAPFGDWVMPYEEACEEASVIMEVHYLQGATLSKQQMKDSIDQMVAWEIESWGGHNDLSLAQVVSLAKNFYSKYTYQIINDLTAEKIRQQLLLGRPVIIPAAGRALFNPNFRSPGPLYHMLVVKGFTKDGKFITNDPGTRNGADYVYTESVLMNAIHDWTGSAPDGPKRGLVVY